MTTASHRNSHEHTMRAVQLQAAGPPSNLQVVTLPIPVPKHGQVLLRIKAFGLNRSEVLTRSFGRAPVGPVQLPRILGIEAVGIIEDAPGSELPKGAIAMTALGGMGVAFDGGYAEYTCVAKENVRLIPHGADQALGWEVLGAIPEMFQTAHGSLHRSLKLKQSDKLLIRGGTTSVGLTAAAIAIEMGAIVLATTRKSDDITANALKQAGVEHIIVDDGNASIAEKVTAIYKDGVDKVLELVGGSTLATSLACLAQDGVCCVTGIVGGSPVVPDFNPLVALPTGRYLTAYAERSFAASNFPLNDMISKIIDGSIKVPIGKVFHELDDIVKAHELMESNESRGKIVVVVD